MCVSEVAASAGQVCPYMKSFFGWGVGKAVQHRPQLVVAVTMFQALLRWRDSGMIAGAAGRLRPPSFALEFDAGRDTWLLIVISLCYKWQTCLSL